LNLFSGLMSASFSPLFAALTFVAVVLFCEGLYLLWNTYKGPQTKKIERRLHALSAGADSSPQTLVLKNKMLADLSSLERLLLAVPRWPTLDRWLLQSGLDWRVSQLLGLASVVAVLALAALTAGGQGLASELRAGLTLSVTCLPLAYVLLKRAARLQAIQTQLPDALDLICRALRAGHALTASLKMVGEEMNGPLARELRLTHDEVNFGVSLHQALSNLGHRVPVTDLRYFTIAVLVQRETGGNLTEVLSNLSRLIRARLKLQSKIRVMTAEGRISAWALGSLPFALAALMHWGNPEFISVLWTDPVGIELTQVTLGLMLLGCLWLWRLTQVRV
jgi:tight adherence protein B